MKITNFHVLWDLPEDYKEEPPLTLPLACHRSQYETQAEYEDDVFKRLEELGGYPVVGFVTDKKWEEVQAEAKAKKKKKLSRKQKKKLQKASKKKNRRK